MANKIVLLSSFLKKEIGGIYTQREKLRKRNLMDKKEKVRKNKGKEREKEGQRNEREK